MGCAPSSKKETDSLTATSQIGQNAAYTARVKSTTKAAEYNSAKEADGRLQLSVREIYAVSRSWKAISRNMSETGVNMFMSLFETNADFMLLFADLGQVKDTTELRSSNTMAQHATTVMFTLDEAVCNLDDIDYVVDILTKTGAYHCKFDNYSAQHFHKMEKPFLLAVKDTLGDRYNASLQHSYEIVIQFILTTLSDGYTKQQLALKQKNGAVNTPRAN